MANLINTASTAVEWVKQQGRSFKKNTPIIPDPPKRPEPEPCPKCGLMIEYVKFDQNYFEEWKKPACKPCERADILSYVESKASEIMKYKGVYPRYLNACLADFPKGYPKKAPRRGLYIEGPRGVGKTHFAAALMRAEILAWEPYEYEPENGRPKLSIFYSDPRHDVDWNGSLYQDFPRFVSASELLLKVRSTFGQKEGESESEILNKYSDAPVLFIDDLGAENPTAWAKSTLFILIDRRYRENLKTYVTSNLSLGELAVSLDDRISSRIAEMCDGFKMDGEDRRLKRIA